MNNDSNWTGRMPRTMQSSPKLGPYARLYVPPIGTHRPVALYIVGIVAAAGMVGALCFWAGLL